MSFIILGNQRSGTSYLLDLINQHPSVDTINEPFSMHLDFFRIDENPWTKDDFDDVLLHPTLKNYPETRHFIRGLERWLNFDFPKVRGFKETALFEKYDWMQHVLSFDHTIIVVRDFRAVINSVLRRKMHRGWWDYEKRLLDYYDYRGPMDDHIICAELLKHRTNYLIDIIQEYPCHVLRLEDLLNHPEMELDLLMKHIGLEIAEEQKAFFRETSKETRDSTYSNFRKKEDVVDKWKIYFEPSIVRDINNILRDQLYYFRYET